MNWKILLHYICSVMSECRRKQSHESTTEVKKFQWKWADRTKKAIFLQLLQCLTAQSYFIPQPAGSSASHGWWKVSVSFSAVTFSQLTDEICGIWLSPYRSAWYLCHLCKTLWGREPIDPRRWERSPLACRFSFSVFLTHSHLYYRAGTLWCVISRKQQVTLIHWDISFR